ncbi:hypothetical protein [Kitasatospora sp. NPDC059599]|uniref:hypothetical protein n=1 Tax=Kitasatospora sp. NPDC059599 TaxID=3346880 RepID=UPI0036BAD108
MTTPSHDTDAAEIQAITEAMVRLLVGVPLRSDGQLTVKFLADEGGLRRNKLAHKHTGLKDLFYALVKAQDSRPEIADDLHRENNELEEKLKQARTEQNRLKETVTQYARVIHVLEVENHRLHEQSHPEGVRAAVPQQGVSRGQLPPRPTGLRKASGYRQKRSCGD